MSEAPCLAAASHLLCCARSDHGVDAGVDRLLERLAVHDQPEQAGRLAGVGGPELGAAGRLLAGVEELERADEALAVVGVDGRGGLRVAGGELRVDVVRPVAVDGCSPVARGGTGRAAGAGRARPGRRAGTGRCRRRRWGGGRRRAARRSPVGAGCVGAGREALGQGHGAHEPVLELALLGRGGRAGEDREARVDLQGVGGDGDGVVAARAQPASASAMATAVLPTPVGPKMASDVRRRGGWVHRRGVSSAGHGRMHRRRVVHGARPPGGCDGCGQASRRGTERRRVRAGDRVRVGIAPRGAGGDARGRPRGPRPRRARRLRGRRRARPRARGRGRHRGLRPGGGDGGRPGRAVPRRRATGRRRPGRRGPARAGGRRRGRARPRPVLVPHRRDPRRPARPRPRRPRHGRRVERAHPGRGGRAVLRRRDRRGRRRGPAARGRGDAALRLPGRGADRARAGDHRGRRARDRGARGRAGARAPARGDRGARRARAVDDRRRPARRDGGRLRPSRPPAARVPRPVPARRRPEGGHGGARRAGRARAR